MPTVSKIKQTLIEASELFIINVDQLVALPRQSIISKAEKIHRGILASYDHHLGLLK